MNRCSQCTLAHYLHMMVGAAADCHFVLSMECGVLDVECGDLSPLLEFWIFGDELCCAKQQWPTFPKSQSGDESPHSKSQGSNTNNGEA